ncbi:MAG: NINE protein [Pseudomonadota bacterium]
MTADTTTEVAADPDFSPEVVNELYRHRNRHPWVTFALGVFLGPLGAHRFYTGRPLTGLLMLLSGGGGLLWWVRDLFYLRILTETCNDIGRQRFDAGLPPADLAFLPPREELRLSEPPYWSSRRSGSRRLVASAILLCLIGFALGSVSGATGLYEPVAVLVLFIALSLIAARWRGIERIPVLGSMVRWAHRLRLFYHTVDPGSTWWLMMRPLIGLLFSPWQPKARAEVRLYLQFGLTLTAVFTVLDLVQLLESGGFWSGLGLLIGEALQTLVYTYVFVAPAGALLTTQLLLARRDIVVWVLAAITLICIKTGIEVVTF